MDALTIFYTMLDLAILFMTLVSFALNREFVIIILGTTSIFVIAMVTSFNILPYLSKNRYYELVNRRVGKHKKNFYLFLCVSLTSLSWILVYTQNNIWIVKFLSFGICLPWLIYVLKYHVCIGKEEDPFVQELLTIEDPKNSVLATDKDFEQDYIDTKKFEIGDPDKSEEDDVIYSDPKN